MQNKTNVRKNSAPSDCLRSFILGTGIPLNKAAEGLGVSSRELLRWWSSQDSGSEKIIQQKNIFSLSQYLSIDEDALMQNSYDKQLVRQRIYDDPLSMPEAYTQNQFSYLRTSAHIIKYLTLTRGQHFSDRILRAMNLSPLIFSNLNSRISLNFFIDLLNTLAKNGISQEELDSLPGMMFLTIGKSALGDQFGRAKTYQDCYAVLASNLNQFDDNFIYRCDLSKNGFMMKAYLPFDRHSHINWKLVDLERLHRYRRHLAGWFPYLSKLPPILPKAVMTILPDGIESTYAVDFSADESTQLYLHASNQAR